MKKIYALILSIMILNCCFFATAQGETARDSLFQVSTLGALQEGVYDGNITLEELKKYGDFAIGTYEGLDGEMLELDGVFYQVKADGKVYAAPGKVRSPFAVVTFFDSDKNIKLGKAMDMKQIQEYIDALLPTKNIFYAIKIEGTFKYIKTRSVPAQSKPYPRLVEVTKNQPTFEFRNKKGTIIGYWFPAYAGGINMTGFHFHFISEDKKSGGHLLECQLVTGTLDIDYSYQLNLSLPDKSDFFKTDLSTDKQKELEKIEK